MKLITAILAIALAIGGAFVTNAEIDNNTEMMAMLDTADNKAQLGYFRTIPSDPGTCTLYDTVNCNPTPITPNCIVDSKQMYDQNCQPLYQDPVQ